jgi:long-subunit acyl-CoA synthetase (AMP-forming)
MMEPQTWRCDTPLAEYPRNLAAMLNRNAERFGERPLYQEFRNGSCVQLLWKDLRQEVSALQHSLAEQGLCAGDRVAILSPNRREMLELELAVMSMGAVAVPIFAGYPPEQAQELVEFCEPLFVAVADTQQFRKLKTPGHYRLIIHFDSLAPEAGPNTMPLLEMMRSPYAGRDICSESVAGDSVCLMMYTSGTMGRPKLVQLTHANILSQQAAMRVLWRLEHTDRFLSYLPWHHSFGGIYEKYAALCNGALLSLEHGSGKQIDTLLENWQRVKPTVFFSVPRIYQQIADRILQDPALEQEIFHDELRFVFTAAAPLPQNISEMFERRHIPVYEGWGLTETSPCCTVTDPGVARRPGVVGKPIPGVSLRVAETGEILVQGPNVMKGYFRNPEATRAVLSDDGWFSTGDIGEFTGGGLRLISRKDRIFKLSNGERVVAAELEKLLVECCCYLSHVLVTGGGRDYPVALLFPNESLFSRSPDASALTPGCSCPGGVRELAQCLGRCLKRLNEKIDARYMRLHSGLLSKHQLTVEKGELTPTMKLKPNAVLGLFKDRIEEIYSGLDSSDGEDDFILRLEQE